MFTLCVELNAFYVYEGSASYPNKIDFDRATELCDARGAELASCASKAECNALRELCENASYSWLVGAFDCCPTLVLCLFC